MSVHPEQRTSETPLRWTLREGTNRMSVSGPPLSQVGAEVAVMPVDEHEAIMADLEERLDRNHAVVMAKIAEIEKELR